MAKAVKVKVKLESSAGTGTFYLAEKNPRTHPEKLVLKKYDKKSKKYYVNELNTIPGSLAFYLWTPLNKEYDELLDDMINIAVKRYKKKLKKTTIFESNILQGFNGTKGTKGFKGKLR